MTRCLVCAEELPPRARGEAHARCSRALFGRASPPPIEVDPDALYLFGQEMAGRVSISGVQKKVSLGWAQRSLRVRTEHSAYILKPQSSTYPELPENEHACLLLARDLGIATALHGLVRLSNGSRALIVRRFDRRDGARLPMEDFCQLAELLPRDKYSGSAELCARVVKRYSAEPGADALRLFRQMVFAWWIGNGDLHLKNLALLTLRDGAPELSPAYDLLSTELVIPGDQLALPVGGKRSKLDRADWLAFAEYCGLPPAAATRELERFAGGAGSAAERIRGSFLGAAFQERLVALVAERAEALRTRVA